MVMRSVGSSVIGVPFSPPRLAARGWGKVYILGVLSALLGLPRLIALGHEEQRRPLHLADLVENVAEVALPGQVQLVRFDDQEGRGLVVEEKKSKASMRS